MDPMEVEGTIQQKYRVSQCLPPLHAKSIETERINSLKNVKEGLELSLSVGDLYRGTSFYIKALNR
jgi:hypothetical protein